MERPSLPHTAPMVENVPTGCGRVATLELPETARITSPEGNRIDEPIFCRFVDHNFPVLQWPEHLG
jgi:hypothetical protein